MILGRQKSGVILALIQPTLNILMYMPYSKFIFSFNTSINVLLLKLYAGIFIFLIMSYMILYIFNKPFKRSIGFQGIDTMSQFVQNWLFNIDVNPPFGIARIGVNTTVDTSTIVFKRGSKIKSIFFLPEIHYGPMGTLGGSNFPYMLERFGFYKYKAPLFVMHGAVNVDNNPIASSQISALEKALEKSVKNALIRKGTTECSFYESKYGSASLSVLAFGGFGLATFTRAPKVTEDIEPTIGMSIKSRLEAIFDKAAVIDAHNSRYETAPASDLAGVTVNSDLAREYINATAKLGKPLHKSKSIKIGFSSVELFNAMDKPKDLAPGNLNTAVFAFNGFKYAILYFNANNILPKLRDSIIKHIKEKYGITAEVYTTDTHMVNKLDLDAANVLGRYSSKKKLLKMVDKAVRMAIIDIGEVTCYYYTHKIRNFKVWGQNARERIGAVLNSVYEIAKVLVPIIIAGAFIVAALIILAV
jgi:putative membrane protein